jgi:hypothetical protein
MNEPDLLDHVPTWAKYIVTAIAGSGASLLFLRQWLSQANVDRTANDSNAQTIIRLQAQVVTERDRADRLMVEREAMVKEIGELRGKVEVLSEQVERLTELVQGLKGVDSATTRA